MTNYSVLMSVYAKENPACLTQAIESVLAQTHPTDDFVLVCDGPLTDGLEAVLKTYEKHLHLVRLPKNVGLGEALRHGLMECRHELVARMDSDDVSVPERCEKQIAVMEAHPEVDFLSAKVTEFQEELTHVTGIRSVPERPEEVYAFSKMRNPMNHPAILFRKSAVLAAGSYRNKYPFFEDYDLWVRMLQNGSLGANLPESLVYMRTSPDLYLRRGGKAYAKYMWSFKRWMHQSGWTTTAEFLRSTIPHVIVCLLPNHLRKSVYKHLRKDLPCQNN